MWLRQQGAAAGGWRVLALLCVVVPQPQAYVQQQLAAPQYLDTERPLWILEDQVRKRDELQEYYDATALPMSLQSPPPAPTPLTLLVRTHTGARGTNRHRQRLWQQARPRRRPQPRPKLLPTLSKQLKRSSTSLMLSLAPHLRLPSHYKNPLPTQRSNLTQLGRRRHAMQPTDMRQQLGSGGGGSGSMPTFDSVPGQDNAQPQPVFLYNGPKGELIVNTMLSTSRYPMHEPVPGQVLYPPTTPMFRPKPLVERFRLPERQQLMNLTLIPFYAHEAISTPSYGNSSSSTSTMQDFAAGPDAATLDEAAWQTRSTTDAPTVLYETQLKPASQLRRRRRQRRKKAKEYAAYHSPEDVQWQPMASIGSQYNKYAAATKTKTTTATTTTQQPHNHRTYAQQATALGTAGGTAPAGTQDELAMLTALELSAEGNDMDAVAKAADFSADFPIIYVDEDTDLATTTTTTTTTDAVSQAMHNADNRNVNAAEADAEADADADANVEDAGLQEPISSRYSLAKEYYAFPVYTLGKLLQSTTLGTSSHNDSLTTAATTQQQHQQQPYSTAQMQATTPTTNTEANVVNTWFILNSRYRGPHKDDSGRQSQRQQHRNYFTSKYIENAAPTSASAALSAVQH